jgi:uncharacterized membrane protein
MKTKIMIILLLLILFSGCVGVSKEITITTNYTVRGGALHTEIITMYPDNTFSFRQIVVDYGRQTNISPLTGAYEIKGSKYILNYMLFGTTTRIELTPKNGNFIDQDGKVWVQKQE